MSVRLERVDRIYRTGERVRGVVVIQRSGSMSHSGITMKVEGVIKLQLSARSVGLFEAFYSSIKPMVLMDYEIDVAKPGKVPDGVTEFPFEFEMEPVSGQKRLFETYHGVYVNCTYTISVECVRGMLKNNLTSELEFIVECPDFGENPPEPVPFDITPGTLENVKRSSLKNIPHFRIVGKLHRTNCQVHIPFTGQIVIESSAAPIKSIELQLVRVETVAYSEGTAREATEIQNIQLADGDVCRDLTIPIYMVFPRLFTCPTVDTLHFKVEFEINLVVLFADGYMVTENFPLNLFR
eukprot:Stramenopile-MAST_4_protein_3609